VDGWVSEVILIPVLVTLMTCIQHLLGVGRLVWTSFAIRQKYYLDIILHYF